MHSIKLFLRLVPHVNIRWKLTLLAYLSTFIQLTAIMGQPLIFAYLIDHVLIDQKTEMIALLLSLSVGLALIAVIFSLIRSGIFRYLGIMHTLDIRDVLLQHIRKIPIPEIEKNGAGKFMALLGYDTGTMGNYVNHVIVELVSQLFMMLLAFGVLFTMDWKLGLLAAAGLPILFWLPRIVKRQLTQHIDHVRTHNEEIGTHLLECIDGSREIRVYGLEQWEHQRNQKMYKGLVSSSTKETLFRVLSHQSSSFVISLVIVVVYGVGSHQVLGETLTIGLMVASVTYLQNALNPVQAINNFYAELQRSEVALQRIESFLQTPPEGLAARNEEARGEDEDDNIHAQHLVSAASVNKETQAAVDVERLQVSYDDVHILKDVDLTVKRNQTAAFVGRSGSGKTTLFRTLTGFMPITSGDVRIHSRRLREMNRQELNTKIGVVFQESYIFKGTIAENIRLGDLQASDEQIVEAACKANLKELLEQLPNGIHTVVDNKGFQLSGGQRQRIAIARMFLKKPDILILDEPTSALDRLTENEVMTALKELMRNKTTLISTHRLNTILHADTIFVMEQGKIVDQGMHAELLERSGLYRALVADMDKQENTEEQRETVPVAVGAKYE
ncbi:ABC transporter ATP-binding protein/permease [Paenibacillus sp. N3/727]|uniref:ABC transporter ATP-binding protein n=1 Tax=Paenibacillus sp. N3/727 TaxID=2925845 RepID=UPI001F5392F4|nr:ABC transporter ATP-binding protein [Paenibacillus sp. N3/727]UNK18924.1 ABC transporter ATP-binding protein/permease [Paenibacillus sp. N3/727]